MFSVRLAPFVHVRVAGRSSGSGRGTLCIGFGDGLRSSRRSLSRTCWPPPGQLPSGHTNAVQKPSQPKVAGRVQSDLEPIPGILWETEIDAAKIERDYRALEEYSIRLLNTAAADLEDTLTRLPGNNAIPTSTISAWKPTILEGFFTRPRTVLSTLARKLAGPASSEGSDVMDEESHNRPEPTDSSAYRAPGV